MAEGEMKETKKSHIIVRISRIEKVFVSLPS